MSEPVEMSLVAALGLVMAGFLFRIAMKIASARRRRIIVARPESHWLDDPNEHKSSGGEQRSGSIDQQVKLIDDLEASVILTASNDTPSHLFRNDGELQETLQRSQTLRTRSASVGTRWSS
jgi:hypothetical protein